MRIIDLQDNGIGDAVVACWIVSSASAVGEKVFINPRATSEVMKILGIGSSCVTDIPSEPWSRSERVGHLYEYRFLSMRRGSRFDSWCESLGLGGIKPVRPKYREEANDEIWAKEQWNKLDSSGEKVRIAVFPEVEYKVRQWPIAYYMDLIFRLKSEGCSVATLAREQATIEYMQCDWWAGFAVSKVAAMIKLADIVISNDSGPAHLAGSIGTKAIAVCGITDGKIVFAHDKNVYPVSLGHDDLECMPCHFSTERGYRKACELGGCQALYRLTPNRVFSLIERFIAASKLVRSCG